MNVLNSLRAAAALMVCLYHSAFLLAPSLPDVTSVLDIGQEGVYVFFVISGMVMPLSMEKVGYRLADFFTFLAKRIVRLHPPLMLSACLIAFNSWEMISTAAQSSWEILLASLTLTAPFFDIPWLNDIYWTLFVEMQYYIYIALIFPLLTHSSAVWRSITVALLLAASFLSLGLEGNAAKSHLPFHLPAFLMGYYLFMRFKKRVHETEFWIGIVACVCVCAWLTGILHNLGFRIAITAAITTLIIRYTDKGIKLLSRIGEVSYSLYLIHWPVISILNYAMQDISHTPAGSVFVFIAIQLGSILFAFVFYRIIEKPALLWSKKITFKREHQTLSNSKEKVAP